jgi:hypothetical protein
MSATLLPLKSRFWAISLPTPLQPNRRCSRITSPRQG